MKIGVFVGSFNPPHDGHIKIAKHLINKKIVDIILLLPTPGYWNKQDLVDVRHRINMLKIYEEDKIIVDDIHNDYPYTYLVLNSLKKDYQDDDLYLILGSDNIFNLNKWKNINEILQYKIIVINRGDNIIKINSYLEKLGKSHFILINNFSYINISSSEIRNGRRENINPKIISYIEKNKLYKNNY